MLTLQALWSVSKEAFWLWPCWILLELCCPLPTSRGMTQTPQTRRRRRRGGAGRPPLRHHRRVQNPSLQCCARRSRPRWWPCPPTPASTNTTSQSPPSCWGRTWCRWPELTASPVSVLMGTSWLWGIVYDSFYFQNISRNNVRSICVARFLVWNDASASCDPSLPSLRPLLDVNYLPLTDMRIARTFSFSNLGQALYLTSATEIQRITYSQETCDNLQVSEWLVGNV